MATTPSQRKPGSALEETTLEQSKAAGVAGQGLSAG